MTDPAARVRDDIKRRFSHASRRFVGALRQLHVQTNADWHNTIFLAGSGRGGTTWVAEIINHDNAYRFIFEPFYAEKVPVARAFRNRQYLRPRDADPRFCEPADIIMSGAFHNDWTDFYNRRFVSGKRLIKEIRANLFLRWLYERYRGVPIVLLMRHPCAVISSRLSLSWHDDLTDFLDQPQLMDDHLAPHRERIAAATDEFEKHLIRWCVENYVPLRQFARGEIHLAFYEEFCERPRESVEALFRFLGRPIDDRVFAQLRRPSSQAYQGNRIVASGGRSSAGWRKDITRTQLGKAMEVLAAFGLDAIYGEDPMPDVGAANALLGQGGDERPTALV